MRFCTNCGERLTDEQAFCPNCGTAAKGVRAAAQPAVTFETTTAAGGEKPKKKKRGWLIALICVLAVLLIGVLLAGYFLLGWFRAPHARLQNYLDKSSKLASTVIRSREREGTFSTDSTLSLDASDITLPSEVDSAAYYLFGMDVPTLVGAVSLDLNVDADMQEKELLLEAAANLSGSSIMGYTFTVDERGFGAYASVPDRYAIASWDSLGVPFPLGSGIEREDIAELVLALGDAGKLLLTKESVVFERGYTMACGDGKEVRCNRYEICPGKDEWEDYFLAIADIMEDNDAMQSALSMLESAGSGMTAKDVVEQLRDSAEEAAEALADSDLTLELMVKGSLPVGANLSLKGDGFSVEAEFTSHGKASSGYRGLTMDVQADGVALLALSVDNEYEAKGGVESGSLKGSVTINDRSAPPVMTEGEWSADDYTLRVDGSYSGCSFDVAVDVAQGEDNTLLLSFSNECEEDKDFRKGTATVSLKAPSEDGVFAVSADYDFSRTEKSILHAPYGTCELSLSMKNVTYVADEMLSKIKVVMTVGEGRNGGSEHKLTLKGLQISDDISIGNASVILTTTDEPSTAKKPTRAEYGDMSDLQDVLEEGLPTNLW